ncbi:MAG TPA: glycine zipper 2TM domain-containing protein [Burkholderiales bacterium]|nr:glycine zipper 2TM domain-containing protein [Burkholderiales bacterium]
MKSSAVVFGLASLAAFAANASDFTDTAKVVSSRPIYQTYTTQECHMVTVEAPPQAQGERQMGGSILGGVAGALLGSQVGQGSGRVAAGAVGAIAGAIAGDRIQNSQAQSGPTQQQVCRDVQRREITGYEVRYIYAGHRASTVTNYPPGNTINIEVTAVQ